MKTVNIKRNRGRLCGFIMGLICSTIGLHIAIIFFLTNIIGVRTFSLSGFSQEASVVIAILILLLSIINVVGAAFIRSRRIVGGVLMMAASITLFSVAVLEPFEYMFFFLTAPVGIASAVLAFIPLSDSYINKLAQRQQFKDDLQEFLELKRAERAGTIVKEQETAPDNEW